MSTASPVAGTSFACTQCPKMFTRRENLSRHLKTHKPTGSHRCSICSKTFTRSDLLKRHDEIHSREIESGTLEPELHHSRKKRKVTVGQSPVGVALSHDELVPRTPNTHLDPALTESHVSQRQTAHGETQAATSTSDPWSDVLSTTIDSLAVLSPELYFEGRDLDDWFSEDFFAALQETGCEWMEEEIDVINPSILSHAFQDNTARREVSADSHGEAVTERASEIPSPPNEPSEEDKWPFAWNPRSNPLMHAENAILIPPNHEIFRDRDSTHDISPATYQKVIRYIHFTNDHGLFAHQKSRISLPELPLMNLFISLFFKHFYPQMPVIHLATLDINKDLPPVLLAIMVVIGAIYSHQKHTRRFAIVLLDLMRKALLMSIEFDNSLIRDPIIIYTLTLICHTGLWCGNKRAFELAEVIRGSVVSYCRRTGFGSVTSKYLEANRTSGSFMNDTASQWKQWIAEETQKRLAWAVYSLDCQFPSLLNLPATISRSEISTLGCPCDEEFWQAPSAWHWRRLLGPASVPPSVSFATAIGPFLVPTVIGYDKNNQKNDQDEPFLVNLNSWSRHLVLLSIQVQIYEFSQELIVVGKVCGDETPRGPVMDEASELSPIDSLTYSDYQKGRAGLGNMPQYSSNTAEQIRQRMQSSLYTKNWNIWQRLAATKRELSDSLSSWSKAYCKPGSPINPPIETPNYFTQSSKIVEKLGRVMLDIPLTDLQDAIGKSGASNIPSAMANLSVWIKCSPQSVDVALESLRIIHLLSPLRRNSLAKVPTIPDTHFSIITYFICHITIWAFVIVADSTRKSELMQLIETCGALVEAPMAGLLKRLLASSPHEPEDKVSHAAGLQKLLFRRAAEGLTRMSTWGCALNLAMMLHKRAEI